MARWDLDDLQSVTMRLLVQAVVVKELPVGIHATAGANAKVSVLLWSSHLATCKISHGKFCWRTRAREYLIDTS
jgi:hypothetical protein